MSKLDLCYIFCCVVYLHYYKCLQQCLNPEKSGTVFKVTVCLIWSSVNGVIKPLPPTQ